jgi:hypothetical protein
MCEPLNIHKIIHIAYPLELSQYEVANTRPFCRTESDIFYTQNASLALAKASSSVSYLVVSEQYLVKALIEASSIVRGVPETILEPVEIGG